MSQYVRGVIMINNILFDMLTVFGLTGGAYYFITKAIEVENIFLTITSIITILFIIIGNVFGFVEEVEDDEEGDDEC